MAVQPLLRALDVAVAMVALAFENDVRGESILVPLQRKEARYVLRGGRASVTRDEVEHQVVPGHRGARADQLLAQARDHEHPFGMNRNVRVAVANARA